MIINPALRNNRPFAAFNPFIFLQFKPINTYRSFQLRTMSTAQVTAAQLQTLSKYTACDIADALVKLKVPNAGYLPDLTPYASGPEPHTDITIAPVSTVIFTSKTQATDEASLPAANIPAGQHWVDLTVPDTFVVLAQPEGQKCAVLGGIMALRMKILKAKGVLVNGRIRDLVELRETGLPIWAKSTSIVGSGLEAKPHAVQITLNLDGTFVTPGDLLFSDATNGVVVIPQEHVTEVVSLLPHLVDADDRVKKDVQEGLGVQEAFKKHRGQ